MTTDRRTAARVTRAAVAGVVAAVLLASCAAKNTSLAHPVRGRVLYKDMPATGASVVFHPLGQPAASQPLPHATVEADGSFRLSTRTQHDGAVPGQYAVTVTWPSDGKKEEDGTPAGPDRLGGRYADPKTTPFRAESAPVTTSWNRS